MKNSLFKRAVAAAAAVPLALTQCLTYSFAAKEEAENEDIAVISTADNSADSKSITLEKLLYIAPDKTESEWNLTISNLIDELVNDGKTTGSFGTKTAFDKAIKNARSYSALAEAVLGKVGDINYEINADKDIVITVDVADVTEALEGDYLYSLGRLNAKLADKYHDDALKNIDYSAVKAGGQFKLVVAASELAASTTVKANLTFTDLDGKTYTSSDEIIAYVANIFEGYKAAAKAGVDASDKLTAEKKAAAYADIEDSIQKYYRVLNVAQDKLGKFLNYSNTVSSVAELIAYADGYAARYTKRDLPESVAAAFELNAVADLFETAKEAVNKAAAPYSFDIEASEIAQFLDSDLRNVEISAENGSLSFYGEFDDYEAEDVAAWYAENSEDKEYVSSYKFIEIKADGTDIKNLNGSADIQIKRVVTTKDKETETTTVTDTTTSSSTTSDTDTTTSSTTTDTDTTTSSTTTDTDTTTSSTTTDTDTTTSSTTTDTDTTTSSTETTSTVTTTGAAVADVYVEYEADYGFYTEQDASFAAGQVSNFTVYAVYDQFYLTEAGMKVSTGKTDPVAIEGAKFGFAATPAETYSKETFKHDINLIAAEDIKDEAGNVLVKAGDGFKDELGNDVAVEVYVGLKGDTNLDNKVTAVDASYVLVYYANLSAGNVDSNKVRLALENTLTEDPAGIYDNFAAFLADIRNDIPAEDAWAVGKSSRKDATIQRSLIATDASAILVYVSNISDGTDSAEAWAKVIG